jgi:predicted ATPase
MLRGMAGNASRSAPQGYETRQGIEAARKAGDYFPDGVAFAALALLGDAALVEPTVSRALGVREAVSLRPPEVLR